MRRLSLVLALAVFLSGCPDGTGKVDPYLLAHTIINQAGLALPVAEGIFNQWVYAQTDTKKTRKARLTFAKVKTLVANGLKLAHDGVYIAEQAKEEPDVVALLAQADDAWEDLRAFLATLLAEKDPGVVVAAPHEPGLAPDLDADVEVRVLTLMPLKDPMDALPASIIPAF